MFSSYFVKIVPVMR